MTLLREYIRRRALLLTEDKRGRVKAMGFPPEFADLLHSFYPPWTHKYADWMAATIAQHKQYIGPLNDYKNGNTQIWHTGGIRVGVAGRTRWTLKPSEYLLHLWKMDTGELRSKFATIFQWLDSKGGGPKLNKMTFDEAHEKAWLHPALMESEEEGEVMIEFEDGWRWVNLQTDYCKPEAISMGHCASDSSGELWSLRDRKGYPHVTCTVTDEGVIVQMKGRNNSVPKSEYHPYIVRLLSFEDITGIKTEKDYDFHLSDLTDEQRDEIQQANPNFEVSEQYSTVELLRNGDTDRIVQQDVFRYSIDHRKDWGIIIKVNLARRWSELFAEDDMGSRNLARAGLSREGIYDRDYLGEDIRYELEREDRWAVEAIDEMLDEKSIQKIIAFLGSIYPDKMEDEVDEDGDVVEEGLESYTSLRDFTMTPFFSDLVDPLTEALIDMRMETSKEQSTEAVARAINNSNFVNSFHYDEMNEKFVAEINYDRLADLVDIHHPGTPMGEDDIITMMAYVQEMYGEEGLKLSIDDMGWYDDAEIFRKELEFYLR